jgi:uncharacterized membrane protein YqjE
MMHARTNSDPGVKELLQETMDDSAMLVRLELALARDELRQDLVAVKSSAILGLTAAILALFGLASLWVALALVLGPAAVSIVGAVLLLVSVALALLAKNRFPSDPLGATRRRWSADRRLVTGQWS